MIPLFAIMNFGHDRDPTSFSFWLFIVVMIGGGIIAFVNRKELAKDDAEEDGESSAEKKLHNQKTADGEEVGESVGRKRCVACSEEIPIDAEICPKFGWTEPA